ncbi:lipopolysaccharide biosynthesis protein [Chryseobacterium oryzae]|uniref:Oligosaccharide flippase family protein n=1 Tax=Chryseobacterium oryzae TaxID=2929799 RepID=A0ABY4BHF6_9FLAO|nr:oligosaccharide flippase family protein [Chryseobacterium oryzae]UOE38602.1 oligosaccharide flippase family protein [Chryseobacterium oryzae]
MKKLLNETIIYGMGSILPRVITFILNPFFIYFINKEEFAKFTNLYAWVSFVNIVLSFGFETSFFRFSAEEKNREKAFYTSFWFLLGTASVFLISVLLFLQPISEAIGYGAYPEYVKWFAWIAFFDAIIVIPLAWLRFNNMPIKYTAIRITQILVQTLVVLSLFLFVPKSTSQNLGMETGVSYTFVSNLIGSLTGVLLLIPIFMKVKFQFSGDLFKKMLKYSYPIMFAGLAFMVNENFDKLVQIRLIPEGNAGAYGGCYKLAALMTLFVTAYRMGVEPFFFKKMHDANAKQSYAEVTEFFSLFAAITALGIIANISWLKTLFVPDQAFWVAIDIVPIIVIANLFFGIYYNLSTWYKVTDRTRIGTYISWSGAIITIALNLLLLPKYGLMVSAWATIAAYGFMMIISYILGQKYYPIPYKTKKIGVVIFVLIVFSYLSYSVFDSNVWIGNTLLLIFAGSIAFGEKKLLLSILKR